MSPHEKMKKLDDKGTAYYLLRDTGDHWIEYGVHEHGPDWVALEQTLEKGFTPKANTSFGARIKVKWWRWEQLAPFEIVEC